MRFASLGSGSEGNALIVEGPLDPERGRPWRLMVDCGFGVRQAEARLERLGLEPGDLDAILVTHEHGDHIGGVFALALRHGITVCASYGTLHSASTERRAGVCLRVCASGLGFAIGAIGVHPYAVPHDAREPTQFVFDDGIHRLGLLTDAGQSTPHIIDSLAGCDGLVMECNHDPAMLEASDYPYPLKRRIAGGYGHLSNERAMEIVSRIDRSRLRRVVAAHLSRQNNTVALAREALASATGWDAMRIDVADQHAGFGWIDLAK